VNGFHDTVKKHEQTKFPCAQKYYCTVVTYIPRPASSSCQRLYTATLTVLTSAGSSSATLLQSFAQVRPVRRCTWLLTTVWRCKEES
jgi:hypothetical protein